MTSKAIKKNVYEIAEAWSRGEMLPRKFEEWELFREIVFGGVDSREYAFKILTISSPQEIATNFLTLMNYIADGKLKFIKEK